MRKIISIFLLLLILLTNVYGFTPYQKPHPGLQINWANPSPQGLVGHWLFNEGSGNKVSDLSGNGNTGIIQGNTSWVPGRFGSALEFFGSVGDDVDISNTPLLNLTANTSMTILLWYKGDSATQNYNFIDKWDGNNGYWLSQQGASGRFYYLLEFDTTLFQGFASSPGPTTEWTQVVLRIERSSTASFFINGVERSDSISNISAYAGVDASTAENLTIGGYSSWLMDGLIDHVLIYNRALTASEIAWLYREPFGMFVKDDIAILATAAVPPPPPTGQVITIIMTSIPLFLIPFFFIKRRKLRR